MLIHSVKLALRVGWLYTGDAPLIKDGLLIWEDRKIVYVGQFNEDTLGELVPMQYSSSICLPAFINSHTHIAETLIRGLADDYTLETWLYDHVWKVEPEMLPHDAYIGATLGMAEMISSGTVGFIDQFYYSSEIAQAVADVGMKAYLHPSIFANNPETGTISNAFERGKEVFDRWHGYEDRIKIGFGPHALYSVDEETFQEIYQEASKRDTWIHTHVLETTLERENAIGEWHKSTIMKFAEMGVLDRILIAHGVHLDEEDIETIARYNIPVLHNPGSNLKLGSGIAPVPELLEAKIPVVLGTDGNASNNDLNILEEIRLAALVHKGLRQDPTLVPARTAISMATKNNSAIFKETYSGLLQQGHWADFTVFDLDTPRSRPVIDPISNLVYSLSSTDCQMTVANGSILYRDGKFLTIDINQVMKDAQESCNRMMEDADYP